MPMTTTYPTTWLAVAFAALCASGCGDGGDASTRLDTATPVEFVIVNARSEVIYLPASSTWDALGLRNDGKSYVPIRACETCACGEVCGGVCGRAKNSVLPLMPGESHSMTWDGIAWYYDKEDMCQQAVTFDRSDQPAAQITYSLSTKTNEFLPGESFLGEPLKAIQSFAYPANLPVRIEIAPP